MNQLDLEELELLDSVEAGEWHSVANLPEAIRRTQYYAQATLTQMVEIPIQLQQDDLNAVKIKASKEGVAYQSLISNLIHQYIAGNLVIK
jgi:predicted DNA binding CopG/RHH family protein